MDVQRVRHHAVTIGEDLEALVTPRCVSIGAVRAVNKNVMKPEIKGIPNVERFRSGANSSKADGLSSVAETALD